MDEANTFDRSILANDLGYCRLSSQDILWMQDYLSSGRMPDHIKRVSTPYPPNHPLL